MNDWNPHYRRALKRSPPSLEVQSLKPLETAHAVSRSEDLQTLEARENVEYDLGVSKNIQLKMHLGMFCLYRADSAA